jgi:hypothetical protein
MTVGRLSHSSLTTYAECGERWRLERLHGVPSESWYATVAGTAVHTITEYVDRADLGLFSGEIPTFQEVFDREIELAERKGVLLRVSGAKRVKASIDGGPNKKDYDWWLQFGPVMVQNWIDFRAESNWVIAMMPDGSPGIEVDLDCPVAERPFKGFIDRVFLTPDGSVVLVDLKTGGLPTGSLQLSTYAVALERKWGLRAEWGSYWSASTGNLSYMKDLTRMDESMVDHLYEMAWRGIESGVFLPQLSNNCMSCGVRSHCRYWGGPESESLPLWEPGFYVRSNTGADPRV